MAGIRQVHRAFIAGLFALAALNGGANANDLFTWQGKLVDGGVAADGVYDLKFRLYDAAAGPAQIGSELVVDDVTIAGGLLTIDLDFGAGIFPGADRWLEIEVKADAGGSYTTLTPRQPLHPTPYAHHAVNAEASSSVSDGGLPATYTGAVVFSNGLNQFEGDGAGLAGLNATNISSGTLNAGRLPSGGNWSLTSDLNVDSDTLVVDTSSNRVGVGTASPSGTLEVHSSSPGNTAVFRNSWVGGFNGAWMQIESDTGVFQFGVGGSGHPTSANIAVLICGGGIRLATGNPDAMRITSAGLVGIGTSAPTELLHLQSGGPTVVRLEADTNNSGESDQPAIVMSQDGGEVGGSIGFFDAGNSMSLRTSSTGGQVPHIQLEPVGGVTVSGGNPAWGKLSIKQSTDSADGGITVANSTDTRAFRIWVDGSDNCRLDSGGTGVSPLILNSGGGDVGIGTTTPSFDLEVNGSAGKPGGGSWSVASDERLKKNIKTLDHALDHVLALRGVSFEYKDPDLIDELPGERIGFITQEVAEVLPDWVDEGPDGYQRLTVRGFEALAVEAMRELRDEKDAQIAQRDTRIDSLEAEVDSLREIVQHLVESYSERGFVE